MDCWIHGRVGIWVTLVRSSFSTLTLQTAVSQITPSPASEIFYALLLVRPQNHSHGVNTWETSELGRLVCPPPKVFLRCSVGTYKVKWTLPSEAMSTRHFEKPITRLRLSRPRTNVIGTSLHETPYGDWSPKRLDALASVSFNCVTTTLQGWLSLTPSWGHSDVGLQNISVTTIGKG